MLAGWLDLQISIAATNHLVTHTRAHYQNSHGEALQRQKSPQLDLRIKNDARASLSKLGKTYPPFRLEEFIV